VKSESSIRSVTFQVIYLGPVAHTGSAAWSLATRSRSRPSSIAWTRAYVSCRRTTHSFAETASASIADGERENLLVEWNLGYDEES